MMGIPPLLDVDGMHLPFKHRGGSISIHQPLPFFRTSVRGGIEGFQSFAKLEHLLLHQSLAIACHNGLLFLRSRQPFEVYCTVGKACGVLDDASFCKKSC